MRVIHADALVILAILLAGCASPTPSATPAPTNDPASTPTLAPTATSTPIPRVPLLKPVGELGGAISALAIRDTTVFAVVGERIETFDVSDPAHPALVGCTGILPLTIGSMAAIDQLYPCPGRQ